jgi:hypothetical protein
MRRREPDNRQLVRYFEVTATSGAPLAGQRGARNMR